MLVGLLCCLVHGTGAWAQGEELHTKPRRQQSATQGHSVMVEAGRLSVDLQEADLAEVLAHIGQQAGIRISSGPSAGKRVSARFSGLTLEEGLRRLLRSVPLSHLFLYAKGPAGAVMISEVRIFGEGAPGVPTHKQNADAPVGKSPRQDPAVVEPVQQLMPEPAPGEPSEVTRRIREVFKLSKEIGRNPSQVQESSEGKSLSTE